MSRSSRRILKELEKFHNEAIEGADASINVVSSNEWQISFHGVAGTVYEGQSFLLRIRFGADYPMDSPEVVFIPPAPVHPHIYSNGHICLNILGEDWSPALTVRSVVLSIISMLSSNTDLQRPADDASYCRAKGPESSPKNTNFFYHDDTV